MKDTNHGLAVETVLEVKITFLDQLEKAKNRQFTNWTGKQYKDFEKYIKKKIKKLDKILKKMGA